MATNPSEPRFPPGAFDREDEGDDAVFYAPPRLVTHIDDGAIAALTDLYRTTLPPGGEVLDLMSSWVSHLPAEVAYGAVIGHGMNAEELAANPRLTRWFVQDLNRDPAPPLVDASLDAALICVGIQYLTRPIEVLTAIRGALRPGAPAVISFSNRCFPTKAVALWRALGHEAHASLIGHYLRAAGFAEIETRALTRGMAGDPLTAVIGRVAI
jgi:SAM-dependent methyltransferase